MIPAARTYADSQEGALALLADLAEVELAGATARPDPEVAGCWLVTATDGRFLVYTTGHAMGPDFEEVE